MLSQLSTLHARVLSVPGELLQRSPYFVLAVVCLAHFLGTANLSSMAIALPTIQKEWKIAPADLQWPVSAYGLTFGGFIILGGRCGDMFGHRRVFLRGMLVFASFSLVAALSPNFVALVVARAFQGIGAAFTIPCAQAHISLYFAEPKKKVRAVAIWGSFGTMGFILGQILGGFVTEAIGWRWIHWICLIISGVTILAGCLVLPYAEARLSPDQVLPSSAPGSIKDLSFSQTMKGWIERFDLLGVFIGIPGILLLNYSLTSANTAGWGSDLIVGLLIASVVLLILFVLHERRATAPLINLELFRNAAFSSNLVVAVLGYGIRQGCLYFLTVQLQDLGNGPKKTAILLLPIGAVAIAAKSVVSILIPIVGLKTITILSFCITIPGPLLLSFMTTTESYFHTAFPGLILLMIGICSMSITSNYIAISSADKKDQGMAAGVFNVVLQLGGSMLGIAIFKAVGEATSLRFGGPTADGSLRPIGYHAVYYLASILAVLGLLTALILIKSPAKPLPAPEKEEKAAAADKTPFVVVSSVDLSSLQEEGLVDEDFKEMEKDSLELNSTGNQKAL